MKYTLIAAVLLSLIIAGCGKKEATETSVPAVSLSEADIEAFKAYCKFTNGVMAKIGNEYKCATGAGVVISSEDGVPDRQ
tara:strand:- start:1588 stop:1827 length:240 start_codon:yes stop_codon:yes gene_type:complete